MNVTFFLMLLLAINFKNGQQQQRYACTDGGCRKDEKNCCSGTHCTPQTPCSASSPCGPSSSYSVNVYLVFIRLFLLGLFKSEMK